MEIFAGGVSAAAASFFTNPLEVVKNRLQVQGELRARGQYLVHYRGPMHGLYVMARTDGPRALQAGLSSAALYQFVMNGLRLGLYSEMDKRGYIRNKDGDVVILKSVGFSILSGVTGGLVASPLFLVKTQMQTSSSESISVGHQHKHPGMLQAFRRIYEKGGLTGLWQGASASIPRISVGGSAQLVTYGVTMDKLGKLEYFPRDGWANNLIGSLVTGVVVAVLINPFDVMSTRLYNQPLDNRLYKNYVDCIVKTAGTEGPQAFFKGLGAQYFRIGPHSFLTLVLWHHSKEYLFNTPR